MVSRHAKGVLVGNHAAISAGSAVRFMTPVDGTAPILALVVPKAARVQTQISAHGCALSDERGCHLGGCFNQQGMNAVRFGQGSQRHHATDFSGGKTVRFINAGQRNDVGFWIDSPFVIREDVRAARHPIKGFPLFHQRSSQVGSFLNGAGMMKFKRRHQHQASSSMWRCSFLSQARPANPSSASCSGSGSSASRQPSTCSASGRSGSNPKRTPLT